jgi:hypothetical protein
MHHLRHVRLDWHPFCISECIRPESFSGIECDIIKSIVLEPYITREMRWTGCNVVVQVVHKVDDCVVIMQNPFYRIRNGIENEWH